MGQLSSVVASFVRLAEENHTVAAFVVTAVVDAQRDPALRSLVGAIQLPTQSFLVEALSEAIERGELVTDSGVAELTEMLLAVLWGSRPTSPWWVPRRAWWTVFRRCWRRISGGCVSRWTGGVNSPANFRR